MGEDQDQCSWLWVEEQGTLAAHRSPALLSLQAQAPTCCSAEQNSSMNQRSSHMTVSS